MSLSLEQSDGFFNLLPGQTRVLAFKKEGAPSLDELRKQLVVGSLTDAF